MMKYFFLTLCLYITTTIGANAQSVSQIRADKSYIYGEGKSTTVDRADKEALSQIISQIVVSVGSETVNKTTEEKGKIISDIDAVVRTYSSATLTNTHRIIIENEPDAHVMRYIHRSEIDRLFEGRKAKVQEMVRLGDKGLEENKIDNALKYYSWAQLLLGSLRYPSEVIYKSSEGEEHRLSTWLPQRINSIFEDLVFYLKDSVDKYTYKIKALYKGKRVGSIDYSYFDGMDWSNIYSAKSGVGVMDLRPGVSPSGVQIKVEYLFENEAIMDSDISSIFAITEPIVYRDAYMKLSLKPKKQKKESILEEKETKRGNIAVSSEVGVLEAGGIGTAEVNGENNVTTQTKEPSKLEQVMAIKDSELGVYNVGGSVILSRVDNDVETYNQILDNVVMAIKNRNYTCVREYFTTEGYATFNKLIDYGNAKVLSNHNDRKYSYIMINDKVSARSLTLSFSFNNNRRTFVEDICFTFDSEKKIEGLSFVLDSEAQQRISGMSQWSESSRYLVISFLENYKTAYALKRLDYLNHIFDDKALIITGRVVTPTSRTDIGIDHNNPFIQLTRQTKQQYMAGLSRVFASNEFVNLKFSSTDVLKFGKGGEIYGIQLKQDYFSQHYGDTGYLFLMVDLNDIERPTIHVRTWQDVRDTEFGIIGPGHF